MFTNHHIRFAASVAALACVAAFALAVTPPAQAANAYAGAGTAASHLAEPGQ
jgi:hypothetical protein